MRSWMGISRFRSTDFEVKNYQLPKKGDFWVFTGSGNGHGVGMCQWGAKVMGDQGFKMTAILKHYYPGAILKKLW